MSGAKEDGELSDGEIDEEVQRETAEMGNGENLPEPAIPRPHSAPATAPSRFSYRESRENTANNSDFGSSDNNSDSDSDNDRSWKRQRTMPTIQPPLPRKPATETTSYVRTISMNREHGTASHATGQQSYGRTDSRRTTSESSSKKRKNNIWGAVLTEQTAERMEKEMTEFDMDTEMERDVESYNYRMALEEAPKHKLGMSAGRMEMEEDSRHRQLTAGLGEDDSDKWLVDKAENDETRGDVKDRLGYKNVKDRLGLDAEIQESREEEMERKKQREFRFGKRSSAKQRLGQRGDGSVEPSRMKCVTFGDNEQNKEVAGKIAFSLDEPKRDLMVRVVDTLGVDKAKELWQQTWDIEQTGGMMIMSGTRRRAPGGVFLQLMKTDEDVTKDQVNEIFSEEKKKDAKKDKEYRRRKRRQQAQGMNFESYLKETKDILAEKRETEKEVLNNKEMELEPEEGQLELEEGQLELMEGAGGEDTIVTENHDGPQKGDVVQDKTDLMDSGDGAAMAV